MNARFVSPLLLAAALAFACGPRSHSSEPPPKTLPKSERRVASALDVKVGDDVRFAFTVTNHTEKTVELTFPSGQTHDIVVLDGQGREVWRSSEGRMYTQSIRNTVLGASEAVSYRERWETGSAKGRYTAVATLTSENHPMEQRIGFEVR